MTATIHHGDCLDVLRGMPDNSVDAICCDPPYGLSNTSPEKVTETIVRWAQGDREYVPQGRGFMGASWDAFVPPVAVWDECLRVLKPGGHLVAFAGSRTQDLMGLAIRLAGFDLRDSLMWVYGSGFPKSLDVSKAIDKARDDSGPAAKVARFLVDHMDAKGITRNDACEHFGARNIAQQWTTHWTDGAAKPRVPRWEQWQELRTWLDLPDTMDAEVWRLNGNKGKPGDNWNLRTITQEGKGEHRPGETIKFDQRSSADRERRDIPATPDAEKWKGWGTSLKPSNEPVILARKPLSEQTVAANVLTWGTGGLNIDATRIGTQPAGRWPANVVLDPDTAKALDQQSGTVGNGWKRPYGAEYADTKGYEGQGMFGGGKVNANNTYTDDGGASRFFKVVEPDPPFMYAAKAPKRERPSYVNEEGKTIQHSTVKPVSIMKWLVRLVTPEGGTVLDPFAGSGTTVEAALLEGFHVIGIEREAEYLPLIQQRIDRATPPEPEPTETDLLDLITGDAA